MICTVATCSLLFSAGYSAASPVPINHNTNTTTVNRHSIGNMRGVDSFMSTGTGNDVRRASTGGK